jgi:hypothetical protein
MKSRTEGFDRTCEPVGGFVHPPTEYSDNFDNSIKRDVLLAATAARSLRAKGIPIAAWREMLMEHLDLNWKEVRFIHRAWLESGLIDELSSVRYPGLMIFGRKPMMEIFQAGTSFVGAITGLVMPKRLEGLKKYAEERSLITAMNIGPSGLVPPHLRIRASTEAELLDFALGAGLSVGNLSLIPFPEHAHRESGTPPYLGYRKRVAYPTFDIPSSVEFAAFESSRGPMFWTASFGGRTAWSYSPAHAEFLACHLDGSVNLRRISSVDLTIVSAFVPLYAARWIVAVGGVPSGPDAIGRYTYRFPSPELLDIFIDYYEKEVSEQLSAWHLDNK